MPAQALLGTEGMGFMLAQHRLVSGRHRVRWLGMARRPLDILHDMLDRALQLHESLEQMYGFARPTRIYDGPDEGHRQSVARQLLRGYERPADGVLSERVRERFEHLLDAVTAND